MSASILFKVSRVSYPGIAWSVLANGKVTQFDNTPKGRAALENCVLDLLSSLLIETPAESMPDYQPIEPAPQVWGRVPYAAGHWCDVGDCEQRACWSNAASGHYRCAAHLTAEPCSILECGAPSSHIADGDPMCPAHHQRWLTRVRQKAMEGTSVSKCLSCKGTGYADGEGGSISDQPCPECVKQGRLRPAMSPDDPNLNHY